MERQMFSQPSAPGGEPSSPVSEPSSPDGEFNCTFPEVLAHKIGSLARELAKEREHEVRKACFASTHDCEVQLVRLRNENARLLEKVNHLEALHKMSDSNGIDNQGDGGEHDAFDSFGRVQQPEDITEDYPTTNISFKIGKQDSDNESREAPSQDVEQTTSAVSVDVRETSKQTVPVTWEKTMESSVSIKVELQCRFVRLDVDQNGFLDARELSALGSHPDSDGHETQLRCQRLEELIMVINSLIEDDGESNHQLHSQLSYKAFELMILDANLGVSMKPHLAEELMRVRRFCVEDETNCRIAKLAQVSSNDLNSEPQKDDIERLWWLEPLVSSHILLNSVSMGVALDLPWWGWQWVEGYFSVFFLNEMLLKIYTFGCAQHFFGNDWRWNLFDMLIVMLALTDLLSAAFCAVLLENPDSALKNLNGVTLIRLARLLRIVRVIRLLRLKFFKELTLMINGICGGLRTLFWAIIFLAVLVYAIGVLMRQVMDESKPQCTTKHEVDAFGLAKLETPVSECTRTELLVMQDQPQLFGSVLRSMFTVFRCFTDGCAATDGTPLILLLWDHLGPLLVIGYVLAFLFVSFGVFNLIMAIFVENTLEYAKVDEDKRKALAYKQHVIVAQQVQQLVLRLCHDRRGSHKSSRDLNVRLQEMEAKPSIEWRHPWRMLRRDASRVDNVQQIPSHVRVTRLDFEAALQDPKVQLLLDEIDISYSIRDKLFDILDSDGNGYLAIGEMVEGFMRLRGPADKGDIVSTFLVLRSLQKSNKNFHANVLEKHVQLTSRMEKFEKRLKRTSTIAST